MFTFIGMGGKSTGCHSRRSILGAATAAAMTLLGQHSAFGGTNGTYTDLTPGGTWSNTADWSGGIVANGQDGVANFNALTLTANNLVHLDTSRTIGQLNFGDVGNSFNWTLDNNGNFSNVLTLSTSTGVAPVISVSNQTATISAGLTGTQGFTKTGSGILLLTGSNNYTGVTTVANGTLALGSSSTSSSAPTPGAALDLDPQLSTITTSSGVVTDISDLSGNGNDATNNGTPGSVTLTTINGHKALSFSGSAGLTSNFTNGNEPGTVFAVISATNTTGPSAIVAGNDGNGGGGLELRLYQSKLQALNEGLAGYNSSTSTVSASTLSIVAYAYNSSNGTYYLNGTAIGTSGAPTLTTSNPFTIGYKESNNSTPNEFFTGSIGTILVYNSVLTSSQIATTEAFLAQEYASSATTLGTTEVNLTSSSSNLSVASGTQFVSSLAGVAGSNVYVGGGILTVGSDNTSTVFSGNISDSGPGSVGTGGQFVKVGTGTLTLAGSVTNTGGTQVNAGTLLVSGSYATAGPTLVTGGTLSITGSDSDTGSHTISGGTLAISGTNSTTGLFSIGSNGTLLLSGPSTATGAITFSSGGLLTLVANSSNITGSGTSATSSAIGSPSAVNYADAATTNVQLLSDSSVTFANACPTSGTGSGAVLNYVVNNLTTATNQTLTLGGTTGGTAGFGTYQTTISVSGGNGYTLAIPAITNANNSYLNLNASTANLSIPGGVTNVGTLTVSGASNTSLGTVTGAGPVVKTGTGTLLLSSSNTYTGATTISAGKLALGSGASLTATSAISIASGATFDISANPSFTLPASTTLLSGSGTINGSYTHSVGILMPGTATSVGTLTINGALTLAGGTVDLSISGSNNSTGGLANDLIAVNGALDLVGSNTLTLGAVSPTLASGTTWTVLTYTGSAPIGTGSLNVSSAAFSVITVPGAIELKYNSGAVGADVWTGSVNSNWDTSTTNFVAAGTTTPISFTNGDNVTFNDSSSVTTVNLTTNLSPSAITVNSNTSNYTFSGSGSITGTAFLYKMGTSTLTISTSNTYSGTTNISGGTVLLTNTAGAGLGTGPLYIGPGATLIIGDGGTDGAINPSSATSPITDNGLLAYNSSTSNFSPPSALSGTGSLYINCASIGIGNQNNYSGGTTIAGGLVYPYEAVSFGTGPVIVNGGEIVSDYGKNFANNFNLSGTAFEAGGASVSQISGTTLLSGNTTITVDNGAAMIFSGAITSTNGSNLILNTAGNATTTIEANVSLGSGQIQSSGTLQFAPAAASTITISSTITGAGNIVHTGAGTTVLAASNSYTGTTTVNTGTLVAGVANALPAGNSVTVATGATLVANTEYTVDTLGSLNINGNVIVHGGNLATLTADAQTAFANGWNGTTGIYSSAAASDASQLHALGVIQNDNGAGTGTALYPTFEGQPVSDSDVLIKYTYYGDTNLDGKVDGTDYSRIDNAYAYNQSHSSSPLTGWFNGDFNYDGVINGSDYTLIDNAFNQQGAQISAAISAQIAGSGATSAVPEPASAGIIVAAAALLGRRRKGCCKAVTPR
jgi:autotransporter-associated beta strand protein